jgi:HK97 family phage portal protein
VKPSFWQGFKAWLNGPIRADAGGTAVNPFDDRYYAGGSNYGTSSGQNVTPDLAMKLAAVYACVRVVSETIASLPLIIYKRLPDGGKTRATEHPLYKVLHDAPNQWQTSMEWVEMSQAHLELRGNAYSLIQSGPRGAVDQLIPLHPDRVAVYRLPNGRLQYKVTDWYTGERRTYAQEEILHNRGLSSDGMTGLSTIALASEAVGLGLAQQDYAARFLENDSQPRGILEHPQSMSEEAYKRVKESWQEAHTGHNRHKAAILEEGMTYKAISLNNKDSQFLEARVFTTAEIARFFRMQAHKIGDLTKATFSNIEQQNIEFATDCIRPRVVRWERRIKVDLIDPLGLNGDEYFCEFLMDALLRGDLKSRYEAYGVGIQNGFMSPNDARRSENMNPISKENGGDTYMRPTNMSTPVGSAPPADPIDPLESTEDANA